MKIYTKTGDKGETGIIGGRISKASDTIELIGTLDEFNASIGLIVTKLKESTNDQLKSYIPYLQSMQSSVFSVGALVAGGTIDTNFFDLLKEIEKSIDLFEQNLPKLQNFILPGGSRIAAEIHMSRSICRKAERRFVSYTHDLEKQDRRLMTPQMNENISPIRQYLNRLSDWMFVFARFVNQELGVEDVKWGGE